MRVVASSAPAFDEVHVVSDLHLGGVTGAQIFNQEQRLAALIGKLWERPAPSLALVLNGDVVDFLADPHAEYLDPAGAVAKLDSVIQSFPAVWSALHDFVASPPPEADADSGNAGESASKLTRQRTLVIVLGNHDVELALPHVRQWLTSWLARGDAAASGRIVWATEGAGFLCTIAGKKVLCVHGNEVDAWNVVDHRALLQVSRAYQRSMPYPEWTPNGGTRLVIDVMNKIKKDFPFVDLLKPETKAAVPILLGIKPSLASNLGRTLASVTRKAWDGLRMSAGFLGEEDVPLSERPDPLEALDFMLSDLQTPEAVSIPSSLKILEAQRRIERGERLSTDATAEDGAYLGGDWFSGWSRPEALRAAVGRLLGGDTTWRVDVSDDVSRELDKLVGADIQYLIAGHTHLRRALQRRAEGCYYYNTGTWIRLIKLNEEDLASPEQFKRTFDILSKSNLDKLDKASSANGEPLVQVLPTVASVIATKDGVYGELCKVEPDGECVAIEGTCFPRKGPGNG